MGIAARTGVEVRAFRLRSPSVRAGRTTLASAADLSDVLFRLLFEPIRAASARRPDTRREMADPSSFRPVCCGGIAGRWPVIPIAALQACGGSGGPSTRRVVLTHPRLSTPLPARWLQPFSYRRHLMPNPTNPDKNQPVSPVKPAVPPVKNAPVQQPVKAAPAPFVPPAKTVPAQPHKP